MTRSSGRLRMVEKTGVLFIDVEGGWGGSSRSLQLIVEALDKDRWSPAVILRKPGPATDFYDAHGIPYIVEQRLPSFRPSERKNAISWLVYLWGLRKFAGACDRIRDFAEQNRCAILHVNHESVALAGARLAQALKLPWVCHIRTQLIPGMFARWLYRKIARESAKQVFISEPVEAHFTGLTGPGYPAADRMVLFNICKPPKADAPPPPCFENASSALRVISLSNFSHNRGVDRIVEVAAALKRRGETDIHFFLFGKPAHTNPLTKRPTGYYQQIVSSITENGLEGIVHLPGHLADPDGALRHADALVKLTRQQNPWGRDIMEGLMAGLPVVSIGHYDTFVENGKNGFLEPDYDPEAIADYLAALKRTPALRDRIRAANQDKANALFGSDRVSASLSALYGSVLSSGAR